MFVFWNPCARANLHQQKHTRGKRAQHHLHIGVRLGISVDYGRFPFTKKFRKFRLGCKWNMIFRFVPLENFRKKRNSWKGSPVFPEETSQWKFVFHLQISRLYHQFHAFRRLSSGQASLVFHLKWRLIRVSFLEAFCKQTFRVTTRALPATL